MASIAPLVAMAVAVPVLLQASEVQAACTLVGNVATCSGGPDTTTQHIEFTGTGAAEVRILGGYSLAATAGDGIDVDGGANITSLLISDDPTAPATISGQVYAMDIDHAGTGAVDVVFFGDLTGTGSNDALSVDNTAAGGDINITTFGTLFGATNHGIHVEQNGSGTTSVVVADGSVTGNTLQGIIVKGNTANAGDIVVQVGGGVAGAPIPTVQGQTDGIEVRQNGVGASVFIDTTGGLVTGITQDGIQVTDTNPDLAHILVSTGDLQAGQRGINLDNQGTGVVWVAALGNITGVGGVGATGDDGIRIVTSSSSGITPAPVVAAPFSGSPTNETVFVYTESGKRIEAGADGIDITHNGIGDVRVESNAAIQAGAHGIAVTMTNAGAGAFTLNSNGSITAGNSGIRVSTDGAGDATVAVNNTVVADGNATGDVGVGVTHRGDTGNILVDVNAAVTFNGTGVLEAAVQADRVTGTSGNVTININDVVQSKAHGVAAFNDTITGTSSIVATAVVSAEYSGLYIDQSASGDTFISTSADVIANGNNIADVGIGVVHWGDTGNITIDVNGAVTFNGTGTLETAIGADLASGASGNVNIDVSGAVQSTAHGIIAYNKAVTGSSSIITTAAVTADYTGVYISQQADGDASITTNADVIANGNATGTVGVGIDHSGTGNLSITTGGLVDFNGTGAAEYAIDGTHTGTGDITIIAKGEVQSESHGITADHSGSGQIKVEAQQKITAKGIGIDVLGGSGVTNIQVIAAAIDASAGTDGIRVEHNGTGNATIAANGTIKAGKDGIFLSTANTTQDASITTAAAITAAENGIDATHLGVNPLQITVGADVTGGSGFAIKTATAAGNLTLLNINSGTVSSTAGKAISNNEGDSIVNLASTVTVQGDISLGNGTDVLNVNEADVSGVTLFDGGDDTGVGDGWVDVLNFNGITLTANGGIFQNWEVFNLNTGSTLTASSGTMNVGQVNVDVESTLNFGNAGAGALTISGDLANAGTVTSQDGATGDQLTVGGNYSGDGTVKLDTFLDDGAVDTTDKLVINGDNNGNVALNIQNTDGPGAYTGNGPTDGIQVVQINGANNGTVFLANGPLVAGAFLYDVTNDGYLQSKPAGSAMSSATSVLQLLPASLESVWERVSSTWAFAPTGGGSVQAAGFAITPTAATPLDMISGFWLRGRYRYLKADADLTVAGAPFQTTSRMHRIWAQLGYTHQLATDGSGMLAGSLFAQYKRTSMDVSGNLAGISSDTKGNAFGGGASLTWLGVNGFYGDLYAEINRHRLTVREGTTGATGKTWATTWRVSIEGGWRMMVAEGINLIPQAQVNVAGSRFNSFNVGGIAVSGSSDARVTGRIGMGLEMVNLSVDENLDLTAQLTASLLHDFSGDATINVGGNSVTSSVAHTFGELRSNLNASVPGSGVSFFLENSFRHSLGGPKQYSIKSSVGVKVSF